QIAEEFALQRLEDAVELGVAPEADLAEGPLGCHWIRRQQLGKQRAITGREAAQKAERRPAAAMEKLESRRPPPEAAFAVFAAMGDLDHHLVVAARGLV